MTLDGAEQQLAPIHPTEATCNVHQLIRQRVEQAFADLGASEEFIEQTIRDAVHVHINGAFNEFEGIPDPSPFSHFFKLRLNRTFEGIDRFAERFRQKKTSEVHGTDWTRNGF